MADSGYLWSRYNACQNQIDNLNREIQTLQRRIETLENFMGQVSGSIETVSSAVESRQALLSGLDTVKIHNNPSKEYQAGMTKSLSGFGLKTVVGAMSGLRRSCSLKKYGYETDICLRERTINALEDEKNSILYLISMLEKEDS